jgi:hypothetical protein
VKTTLTLVSPSAPPPEPEPSVFTAADEQQLADVAAFCALLGGPVIGQIVQAVRRGREIGYVKGIRDGGRIWKEAFEVKP